MNLGYSSPNLLDNSGVLLLLLLLHFLITLSFWLFSKIFKCRKCAQALKSILKSLMWSSYFNAFLSGFLELLFSSVLNLLSVLLLIFRPINLIRVHPFRLYFPFSSWLPCSFSSLEFSASKSREPLAKPERSALQSFPLSITRGSYLDGLSLWLCCSLWLRVD